MMSNESREREIAGNEFRGLFQMGILETVPTALNAKPVSQNFGVVVRVRLDEVVLRKVYGDKQIDAIKSLEFTYHNVTEIHYGYKTADTEPRIAFESDIHATGGSWRMSEVAEFETTLETKIVND